MDKIVLKTTDGNIYIGERLTTFCDDEITIKVEEYRRNGEPSGTKFYDYLEKQNEYNGPVTFNKSHIIWYYTKKKA